MLAYLRALADPLDELALYGALAVATGRAVERRAGVDRAGGAASRIAVCGRWLAISQLDDASGGAGAGGGGGGDGGAGGGTRPGGGDQERAATDAGLRGGERERAAELCAWLERERGLMPDLKLAELLERAIEHGGHRDRLLADEDAGSAGSPTWASWWSWRGIGNAAKDAICVDFSTRPPFSRAPAAPASGERRSDRRARRDDYDAAPDAVRLMSVHAAKGLEFDVVCVADLGRAPSMGVPDLLVSRADRRAK